MLVSETLQSHYFQFVSLFLNIGARAVKGQSKHQRHGFNSPTTEQG